MKDPDKELDEYLARIRKTIADSEALIQQTELRMQETDRLLESQGLTREQVLAMRFTKEQKLAVNEELKRRGLPPLDDTGDDPVPDPDAPAPVGIPAAPNVPLADSQGDLENRQKKFGMMMKPFSL
ncbi:MAG: hypothetical protein II839_06525 [Kiritimatiellae bacterium]|jgi:hypothetical protein|nr:hypothetical protein [Kiritimatiellia bacterium]